MKIKIEIDSELIEDEVVIKCSKIDATIQRIQQAISDVDGSKQKLSFYKEDKEYYFPLDEVLFFETNNNNVDVHTIDNMYHTKYRLYELEEILSNDFIRVSKSTILNLNHIYSIERNIASSSIVQFYKTHKQVYVSRFYYKYLREKLNERRNRYES